MRVYQNFNLTNFNSYQLNSECSTAYFPSNENDLLEIFSKESTNRHIIGNGNNIILTRPYYDADFVIFTDTFNEIKVEGNCITAEAGAIMKQLSEVAANNCLSGLEVFYDIPSSLGGAVVMNAGASGEEIKDVLKRVRYFDTKNICFNEISNEEIGFTYRNSFFQMNPHLIVTKVWMELQPGNKAAIEEKMEMIRSNRWAKQPRDYPSAGSVFKRPQGKFVGPMIEELGLKGFAIGGAKVSEKHAGFIINAGGATGKDLIELIDHIKGKVKEKYDIDLQVEQRII